MQQPSITNNPAYLYPNINRLLQNFTKYVSKPLGLDKPYSELKAKNEIEYASSLVLQVLIYFNVYYFPCWFIGNVLIWPVTVSTNRFVYLLLLFAFILMVLFDAIRLFLAYIGNLRERVPELTGFWLLTLIIELPLCLFSLVTVWFLPYMMPMQFALELVHSIFIVLETIFGFIALKTLSRYQVSRFHYKQFDMSQVNDNTNTIDDQFNWIRNMKAEQQNASFNMKTVSCPSFNKVNNHRRL